jgi:AcrR family transcriptional regulator
MKQSPKQPAEKRRAQLIKAAGKVFARKGYTGATTEEIARNARLTKGALYFHFRNKEDVFFAVIKSISEKNTELILRNLEAETDPEVMLEKSIHSSFEMIDRQMYAIAEFWEQAYKIPKIKNYLAGEHRRVRDELVCYLNKNSSLKKRECESLFFLLHAIFDGVILRQKFGCSQIKLKRLADQVIEISKLYLRKNELR